MAKFRKKPVVIEAWQLPENWPDRNSGLMPLWLVDGFGQTVFGSQAHPNNLTIFTLEGTMTAEPGDWIIKGVADEFYPCKPEIFEQAYEAAEA